MASAPLRSIDIQQLVEDVYDALDAYPTEKIEKMWQTKQLALTRIIHQGLEQLQLVAATHARTDGSAGPEGRKKERQPSAEEVRLGGLCGWFCEM